MMGIKKYSRKIKSVIILVLLPISAACPLWCPSILVVLHENYSHSTMRPVSWLFFSPINNQETVKTFKRNQVSGPPLVLTQIFLLCVFLHLSFIQQ